MFASILAIAAVLVSGWILASLIDGVWTYLTRDSNAEESDTPLSN